MLVDLIRNAHRYETRWQGRGGFLLRYSTPRPVYLVSGCSSSGRNARGPHPSGFWRPMLRCFSPERGALGRQLFSISNAGRSSVRPEAGLVQVVSRRHRPCNQLFVVGN